MEFPDEKKEDLTNCVSKYQHLYDKGNKHYLNRDKKDATWKEIAKELALPGTFYLFCDSFISKLIVSSRINKLLREKLHERQCKSMFLFKLII